MKSVFAVFVLAFACALPLSARAAEHEGAGNAPAPVLQIAERDPRTFCPYERGISREHLLIFVDVTHDISEQQMNLLKNDILTDDLFESVGLYGRVSLVVLDGNGPVTTLVPQFTVCRPKSGNSDAADIRDRIDILTENRRRIDIEYRIGYLRRLRERALEIIKTKAEGRNTDGATPLMESIHEISRSAAIDFGSHYDKKTLVIVSNMYHNSESVPLDKLCVKRRYVGLFSSRYTTSWNCPSFDQVKNKRSNRFYLEKKIRPRFKGEVDVKLWILYRDWDYGGVRDDSLLTFWEGYFDYVLGDVNFIEPDFESDPS